MIHTRIIDGISTGIPAETHPGVDAGIPSRIPP